jgi:hypothetical protein
MASVSSAMPSPTALRTIARGSSGRVWKTEVDAIAGEYALAKIPSANNILTTKPASPYADQAGS